MAFKDLLRGLAVPLEEELDRVKGRLAARFDRDDPVQILPYRGYGTAERVRLTGRVLQDEPVGTAGERDSVWRNLGNTWKRFESDEVPGARLRARYGEWTGEVTADEEGYFTIEAPAPSSPGGGSWRQLDLELLAPTPGVRATGAVLVPPADAELGVISDIDDTVVETGVTRRLAMARTVFLGNARTRLPFAGVAAFYEALCRGSRGDCDNPVFFVSNSPWNMYDLLIEFMELQKIPRGPLLLRDLGLDRGKLFRGDGAEHKLGCIRPILDLYPALKFILIGDSGERDPEIYRQVVREYPRRILAVYIRRIGERAGREDEVLALAQEVRDEGVPMLLCQDTEAAAVHAAAAGWIHRDSIPDVQDGKEKDESSPTPLEAVIETDPAAPK
jgi:phosphatidate phosphatase APP1